MVATQKLDAKTQLYYPDGCIKDTETRTTIRAEDPIKVIILMFEQVHIDITWNPLGRKKYEEQQM